MKNGKYYYIIIIQIGILCITVWNIPRFVTIIFINVLSSTIEEGYFSTKISTQGMFLENGQTTVLFGVKEDEIEKLFGIIEKNVTKRVVRHVGVDSTLQGSLLKKPVDVEEYGAVAFVLDVDQFRKL